MLRVKRSKPRELQEHEDEGHSLLGRWVNSHELRAGDCIITRSGTRAIITEIRQRFDDAFPVSNLNIIGHHNYAVGDVGVLVHNVTVCDETIKDLRELSANGKGKSPDELRELLRSKKNDKGERLYNEDEINDAMGKVLAPEKAIYNGIKDAPEYPQGFKPRTGNHTTRNNVNNKELLDELRQIERGDWKKVYKDGYDANGNRISIHFFQSPSGKVFNVKVKPGWSN
jgi:hypothetical protein